jgi:hypothetical protein
MRLDVSHKHRQQSQAAWADNRGVLNFVVMNIGWHVGPLCGECTVNFNLGLTYRVRPTPLINSCERTRNVRTIVACVTIL